MIFGQYKKDQ